MGKNTTGLLTSQGGQTFLTVTHSDASRCNQEGKGKSPKDGGAVVLGRAVSEGRAHVPGGRRSLRTSGHRASAAGAIGGMVVGRHAGETGGLLTNL